MEHEGRYIYATSMSYINYMNCFVNHLKIQRAKIEESQ